MESKWICINNSRTMAHKPSLTINKLYIGIWVNTEYIQVINDEGREGVYHSNRFITLAEWREKQIKSVIDGS